MPVNPTVSVTPSPTLLTFQYPGQVTQNVAVIASGGNVNYTPAVQVTIARVDWLTVGQPTGPAFGDARSTFPVTVNPQSLAPGTYRGTITIHPAGGAQDALVNVELVVSPSTVSVAPGALRLSQVAGRAPFSGGTISVASTGGSVPFTASVAGANWLTVSPSTGFTPAQIAVSVNGSGLAAGNYTGEINVSTPGASNPLQSVSVVLSVEPAQSLRLSTSTLNFTSEAGTVAPPPQTIGASLRRDAVVQRGGHRHFPAWTFVAAGQSLRRRRKQYGSQRNGIGQSHRPGAGHLHRHRQPDVFERDQQPTVGQRDLRGCTYRNTGADADSERGERASRGR